MSPSLKSFARQKYEKQRFHGATENTKQHLRRFAYVQQFQMMGLGSMGRIIAGFAFSCSHNFRHKFPCRCCDSFL